MQSFIFTIFVASPIRLLQTYAHTGTCQASETKLLAKIFIDLKLLTILEKDFRFRCLAVLNAPLGEE